jgi:hypothetical protein
MSMRYFYKHRNKSIAPNASPSPAAAASEGEDRGALMKRSRSEQCGVIASFGVCRALCSPRSAATQSAGCHRFSNLCGYATRGRSRPHSAKTPKCAMVHSLTMPDRRYNCPFATSHGISQNLPLPSLCRCNSVRNQNWVSWSGIPRPNNPLTHAPSSNPLNRHTVRQRVGTAFREVTCPELARAQQL